MDADHGTRARYVRGCKCLPCRASNASYEAGREARAAESVLVDAAAARKHLQWLSDKAVGHKQASKLSGLSWVLLYGIRSGRRTRIRKATAEKVLAIQPIPADGARINSYRSRHLIACLLNEGFTMAELARRSRIHVHRHGTDAPRPAQTITAGKARAIRRFFQRITAE
jgi:hypothetical protein